MLIIYILTIKTMNWYLNTARSTQPIGNISKKTYKYSVKWNIKHNIYMNKYNIKKIIKYKY